MFLCFIAFPSIHSTSYHFAIIMFPQYTLHVSSSPLAIKRQSAIFFHIESFLVSLVLLYCRHHHFFFSLILAPVVKLLHTSLSHSTSCFHHPQIHSYTSMYTMFLCHIHPLLNTIYTYSSTYPHRPAQGISLMPVACIAKFPFKNFLHLSPLLSTSSYDKIHKARPQDTCQSRWSVHGDTIGTQETARRWWQACR